MGLCLALGILGRCGSEQSALEWEEAGGSIPNVKGFLERAFAVDWDDFEEAVVEVEAYESKVWVYNAQLHGNKHAEDKKIKAGEKN